MCMCGVAAAASLLLLALKPDDRCVDVVVVVSVALWGLLTKALCEKKDLCVSICVVGTFNY